MTVMVPIDKASVLGLRPIVRKDEAELALNFISEDYAPIPTDWKLRYQMNLDLLKKGSIMDIASVVRSLYHRSKIKELPILERKLYDSAINLLQDEIAYSLGKPKDEIAELIHARLESCSLCPAPTSWIANPWPSPRGRFREKSSSFSRQPVPAPVSGGRRRSSCR